MSAAGTSLRHGLADCDHRNRGAVRPLHIHYFYDEPLPNRFAASIQIIRTGAEIAARGLRFTFHSGPLDAPQPEILAAYGEAQRPGFELSSFFPSPAIPRPLRSVLLRRRLHLLQREILSSPAKSVVMTRGETAFDLLPLLETLSRNRGPDRPVFVYEVHRLCFLRELEKHLGRAAKLEDVTACGDTRLQTLERRVLALADGLVLLTPEVANAVEETFGVKQPCSILPSGVDPPSALGERPSPDVDVVYAGKVELRKGVFDLCAAMAHLPGRRLAIAGGSQPSVNALRAHAASLGVAERVDLLGWLPPSQVQAFLLRGRVGTCPLRAGIESVSDRFASPMKLLQMLSLGLPVVASDLPPVRAVVTHAREALLVRPNDPKALAAAITRILQDRDLSQRLGEAGRQRARAFAWSERARRLKEFLDALA